MFRFIEKPQKDALVNDRKNIAGNEQFYIRFVEPFCQAQFLFHGTANIVQDLPVVTPLPLMDKIIAVRRTMRRYKVFKVSQNAFADGMRESGYQNMGSKKAQGFLSLFIAMLISGEA